jgi:hypothetical protein
LLSLPRQKEAKGYASGMVSKIEACGVRLVFSSIALAFSIAVTEWDDERRTRLEVQQV